MKESRLFMQEVLNKYDKKTGPKGSRGIISIMAAKEEDLDHFETAYEVMAQKGSIKITIGDKAIALNMATKKERANRSMLTQEESEGDPRQRQQHCQQQELIQDHRIQRIQPEHHRQQ
jgi:hypothetical protein